MAQVQQGSDGMIFVRNAGTMYGDTSENFALDFARPVPPLIAGATSRLYDNAKGVHDYYDDWSSLVGLGEQPWADGDTIIALLGPALEAQTSRRAAALADSTTENQRRM